MYCAIFIQIQESCFDAYMHKFGVEASHFENARLPLTAAQMKLLFRKRDFGVVNKTFLELSFCTRKGHSGTICRWKWCSGCVCSLLSTQVSL